MPTTLPQNANAHVSLGSSHGYRFEGDTAILTAELAIDGLHSQPQGDWALQLWACEEPHQGGQLRGIKIAEAAVGLSSIDADRAQLEAAASAQLPPAQRAYAMVLVLASGAAGIYDQVHDFSNYPLRQGFTGPHLEGNVGYRFEQGQAVLSAERIRNPRELSNLSGTLSLELWALPRPYEGGAFDGVRLAHAELGCVAGESVLESIEQTVALTEPGAGEWHLSLMLREWTSAFGYITRDFCNFAQPYTHPADDFAATSYEQSANGSSYESAYTYIEPSNYDDAHVASESVQAQDVVAYEAAPSQPEAAPSQPEPTPVASAPEPVVVESAQPVAAAEPVIAKPVVVAQPAIEEPAVAKALEPAIEKPAVREPAIATPVKTVEPAPEKPQAVAAVASAPAVREVQRLSLKVASVDELSNVPGLNKKLATAIVQARPFKSVDDLTRVRGIGDKLIVRLRAFLTL